MLSWSKPRQVILSELSHTEAGHWQKKKKKKKQKKKKIKFLPISVMQTSPHLLPDRNSKSGGKERRTDETPWQRRPVLTMGSLHEVEQELPTSSFTAACFLRPLDDEGGPGYITGAPVRHLRRHQDSVRWKQHRSQRGRGGEGERTGGGRGGEREGNLVNYWERERKRQTERQRQRSGKLHWEREREIWWTTLREREMDKETDRQRHRDREKKKRGGTEGDNNNKNTANLPSAIPSHHIHSKYLDDKSKLLISQSPQAAQQRRKIPSPCCFSFPPNFFLSFFLVFFFPVLPREDNTLLI